MEKKSRGKTIVIVILVLIVLGLGGYIVYDKVIDKEPTKKAEIKEEKKEEFSYSYEQIKGLYQVKKTDKLDNGEVCETTYNLYLYEDGTFINQTYSNLSGGASHLLGNYIIKNNEIILNYLFSQGSDVTLTVITRDDLKQREDNDLFGATNITIDKGNLKYDDLLLSKIAAENEMNKVDTSEFRTRLETGYLINNYKEENY